jgi:hypothetical protein
MSTRYESPIEELLGEALKFTLDNYFPPGAIELVSQFSMGNFRYDFAIILAEWPDNRGSGVKVAAGQRVPVFLIECDGKEFHGPAQYDNDIAKNELARAMGSYCLRYRGAIIWRNPYLIADEISRATNHMWRWYLRNREALS